jgi:hypothetical protein
MIFIMPLLSHHSVVGRALYFIDSEGGFFKMTSSGVKKIADTMSSNGIIIDGGYVYIGTQYSGEAFFFFYDPDTSELIVIECRNYTTISVKEKLQSSITPPSKAPKILEVVLSTAKYKDYRVNYAYLSDASNPTTIALVQEGDMFLGWHVDSIDAAFRLYDDGSISYYYIIVQFKGEVEINARLEYQWNLYGYYDLFDEDLKTVIATVNVDSFQLFPIEPWRKREIAFELSRSDAVNRLINNEFGEEEGIIEDCKITVQDYMLYYKYGYNRTDLTDTAVFIRLVR